MRDETNTPITYDIRNDTFRAAFEVLMRAVRPLLEEDAYHTDILWDANWAAHLREGAYCHIMVRDLGTSMFSDRDDAVAHAEVWGGRAVITVTRGKYNTFTCETVWTQGENR